MGNLEKKVIEMRTRVINDFCHKISKFEFILESDELQIFLIRCNDVSKVIVKGIPQSIDGAVSSLKMNIYEKMIESLKN